MGHKKFITARHIFVRNTRVSDLLEIFFISSVTSVLLLRFYLHITNYPIIGNGSLHIAHVLWGGLLLMAGVVVNLAFLGYRAQKVAALLGGIGFGIFVDEIGKFITQDNNYFYQPAIGILYAIFVCIFVVFNYLDRSHNLTQKEYQINALYQIEEAIVKDMSAQEKRNIISLLSKSGSNELTHNLRSIVKSLHIKSTPDRPNKFENFTNKIDRFYEKIWQAQNSNILLKILFVFQLSTIAGLNIFSTYKNLDDIAAFFDTSTPNTYGQDFLLLQFVSSLTSMLIVLYGIYRLASSRLQALQLFKLATIITLFLTQFFLFLRIEFSALPNFVFNLSLYAFLVYVIDKEKNYEEEKRT